MVISSFFLFLPFLFCAFLIQSFSCPSLSFAVYTGSSLTAPLKDDQSREEARHHSALSAQNALPCKTSSIICAPKRPRPCRELVCKITPRSPGHCEGGHGALSFSRESSGGRGCCDPGHCLCSPASGSVRLVSLQDVHYLSCVFLLITSGTVEF